MVNDMFAHCKQCGKAIRQDVGHTYVVYTKETCEGTYWQDDYCRERRLRPLDGGVFCSDGCLRAYLVDFSNHVG